MTWALHARKVRFASYSLDLRSGDLTRDGSRLRLETQPTKILECLLAARGELVSRGELIDRLWPGEVEGNFDGRLDKAIAKLRGCLNDDPLNPRYIETVRGRGYRFLGEVTLEPSVSTQPVDLPPVEEPVSFPRETIQEDAIEPGERPTGISPPPAPPSKRRFPRFLVAAACIFFLTALAILPTFHGRSSERTHAPVLLVMGFRDSSQSAADTWVSRAVSEWLTDNLERGKEVQVIRLADNAVFAIPGTGQGCRELRREEIQALRGAFAADSVIYGGYSETEDAASGNHWRLNVCLQDMRNRHAPEEIVVVGAKGDISQLVFSAGQLLRSKLGLSQLSSQSLGFLRATLPSSLAAARLYTEGTFALEHFQPEEATALLTQALQIESTHAPTHAALSTAWGLLGYEERSRQEALLAKDLSKALSPVQQLEYEGLADEATNNWADAIKIYSTLFGGHPDSIGYAIKLANAQTKAAKAQLALATIGALRARNRSALTDPQVDLGEAAADSVLGDFKGQLAASKQAEVHAESRGAELLVADAQMAQGNADDMLDNWAEAFRLWRQAEKTYESIGDRAGMAAALNHQADLAWKKGDAAMARKTFGESINLSRETGDNLDLAYALAHLGIVRMAVDRAPGGEMPEAVRMYLEAISIYHSIANTAEEGYVYSLLGDEAMQRAHYEDAHGFYEKAMAMSQAANDRSRVAGRLMDLGIVAESEGHSPEEAIHFLQQSSQLYEELGQKDRAAIARIRLGISLYRSGRIEEAERMLEDSLALMRSLGRLNQVREVLGDLARVELARNPAKAEEIAKENLDLNRKMLAADVCCTASFALVAEAMLAEGKLVQAKESIARAFPRDKETLPIEWLPDLLLARGDIEMADKDYAAAQGDFENALKMARRRGAQYMELQARLGLAELSFLKRGDSTKRELDLVRRDADRLGFAIFDVKIDAFLRTHQPAAWT